MSFSDWTLTGSGALAELDSSIKYEGNSSLKMYRSSLSWATISLTHDTFSETEAQIVFWGYVSIQPSNQYNAVNMSSYGDISCWLIQGHETWEHFRTTFWYDADNDTKYGRLEMEVASVWVQQGNDINFGTGSPALSDLVLKARVFGDTHLVYFDYVEVYK